MLSKKHSTSKGTIAALLAAMSLHAQAPMRIDRQKETGEKTAAACPIRFAYQPINFVLDSSETPQCYAPETMAGGVAR